MFSVSSCSGLTLIRFLLLRLELMNSATPTDIFLADLIATFCATWPGDDCCFHQAKNKSFQPTLLAFVGGVRHLLPCCLVLVKIEQRIR